MKSLKESLLDTEENLYKNSNVGRFTKAIELIKAAFGRMYYGGKGGSLNTSKIKNIQNTDACGKKLEIGDLVIVAEHTGGYTSIDYFTPAIITGFYKSPDGSKVKINILGEYDPSKSIENNHDYTVFCGSVLKVSKSIIQNLYK